MDEVNRKQTDEDLAALLCALSFATGLAFGGHMEHGLGSAYLGLEIADELRLANEEREAIFYGALLKDVACTACSAGIAAFLPEGEEEQSTQEALLARRPSTLAEHTQEDQIEQVCEVLADFVDLKTRETWHHSRVVAEVAVGIGTCLGLDANELKRLRCAALVHDIGKVAIPFAILAKGARRTGSEWESYRLHPYYTQRILERVNAFRGLAQAAAAHHEWMNGQGYHRQLCGEQIPFHGRILAVANTYARLVKQQGHQEDSAEALRKMSSQVGVQFDSLCYEALVTSLAGESTQGKVSLGSRKVGNLTGREVEVLCLLAQGCNNPQIARRLDISRKTVEHHLSHIYNKIGVTCRTAAVVYAIQQGLV